jgi:hypothetical protein
MTGSASAPRPREARVMPNWQAEIIKGSCSMARSAVRARREVLSSGSSLERRLARTANSAPTKNPFAAMSANASSSEAAVMLHRPRRGLVWWRGPLSA